MLLEISNKATIQNWMHHNTKNAESLFWLEYEQNQTIILWLESPLTVHTKILQCYQNLLGKITPYMY